MIFPASRRKFLVGRTSRVFLLFVVWICLLWSSAGVRCVAQTSRLSAHSILTVTVGTLISHTLAEEQLWTLIPIQQSRGGNSGVQGIPMSSYLLAICGTEYCGDSLVVYVWQRGREESPERGLYRCVAQLALSYNEYYPPKQQSALIRHDSLIISSELSERATRITLMYRWDTTQTYWRIMGYTVVDSSEILLTQARAEIAQGRFGSAVTTYQKIMYPESYYDVQDEAIKMIQSAAEYARSAARRKDMQTAYAILDTVFATPDGEYFLNYSTLDELLQDFSMLDEPTINFNGFRDIVADYALYALRCQHYDRSIELASYLLTLDATYAPARLWLADAQFGAGEKAIARREYKRYHDMMTSAGKQKDIPKRVVERVR